MNHEVLWTYRRPLGYALSYLLVLATSTHVVEYALVRAGARDALDDHRDTGTVVGKLENVLVLTLIYAGAYTAIGLVFAAKSLLRIEDTDSGNSTYYLTGTLANFTWSTLVGTATYLLLASL